MLYLLLPYTSQMTGRLDHFLPAALLVWAILFYRQPIWWPDCSGAASGCIYYPLFVIPAVDQLLLAAWLGPLPDRRGRGAGR